MPQPSRRVAPIDVLLLLMTLIWGTNYAIVKRAFAEIDPQAFNALRMIVASSAFAVVIGWAHVRGGRARTPPDGAAPGALGTLVSVFHTRERLTGRDWMGLVALGVVGQCLYQYAFIAGLSQTSVANSALLVAVTPVLIALTSALSGREPVGWGHWTGAALSIAGIYIVVGSGASMNGSSLRGDLTMLLAVVCWTVYTLGAGPLMRRHSPVGVTGLSMIIGSMLYVPLVSGHLRALDIGAVSRLTWLTVIYSALFSLCVAYTIWYAAVKQIGSARTSIYSNLVPVVAMLTAVLFLDDVLSLRKLIGAAAVLAGIALTRVGPGKMAAPAE